MVDLGWDATHPPETKMNLNHPIKSELNGRAPSSSQGDVPAEPLILFNPISIQPRKKKLRYFPLNQGCLMAGSLIHGLWNDAHITG